MARRIGVAKIWQSAIGGYIESEASWRPAGIIAENKPSSAALWP